MKDGPGGVTGPSMMRGEEGPPPYIDRRQNGPSEPQRVPQNQQRPVPQPRNQAGQVMQTNRGNAYKNVLTYLSHLSLNSG